MFLFAFSLLGSLAGKTLMWIKDAIAFAFAFLPRP
jgi:hypothetical protein